MKKLLFALTVATTAVVLAATDPFKPGERVVFLGDSITNGGWFEDYVQFWWALKHPGDNITVFNCGVSGQRAKGGFERIDWEVKPLNPDRVFVMFGMNDVARDNRWTPPYTEDKLKRQRELTDIYIKDMTRIAKGVKGIGSKAVFITPTPFDEYNDFQKAERCVGTDEPAMRTFAEHARAIAAAEKLDTVEFYNVLLPILKQHPEMKFLQDRVHPGKTGHLLMAALILKEMGEDGHVESTEFDAAKGNKFTYAPKRLPFPAVKEFLENEKVYPIAEAWNKEILKFKNLKDGKYALKLGRRVAGEYTAKELAKGVDLGKINDPKRCSPSMTKALAAYKTWEQFHVLQNGLRVLTQTFVQVKRLNGDITKLSSCIQKYLEWIGVYRTSKSAEKYYYYYGNQIPAFIDKFRDQQSLIKQREDLRAQLNALRPEPYEVELVAVK